MKILQINNVYGGKSTGKITMELHEGLIRQGHESLVVYGRGATVYASGVQRLCPEWYGKVNALLSRMTGIAYGGCRFSTEKLKGIIRREKPDVVHLQCLNGNFVNIYRLVEWLRENHIKTVLTLHAEFMYTANCGHAYECDQWVNGCTKCPDRKSAVKSWFFDSTGGSWRRMKKAFAGFGEDLVVCPVSPWTEERARQSGILKAFAFKTVFNGVNTEVFNGANIQAVADRKNVLHVTAQFSAQKDHPKGGFYVLELARKMPEVTFYVAGPAEPLDDLPENVILLGLIEDQHALAELYRTAQLTILTSRRETFSMPCAESLCCGTPVVGFKAGGPERIALAEGSVFVEYGDVAALEGAMREMFDVAEHERMRLSLDAIDVYSVEKMVRYYLDVYRSLL